MESYIVIIDNFSLQPPGIQVIQVDGANDSDSEDDDDDDDEDDLEDDKKDKSQEGLDDADLDVSIVHSLSNCNCNDLPYTVRGVLTNLLAVSHFVSFSRRTDRASKGACLG